MKKITRKTWRIGLSILCVVVLLGGYLFQTIPAREVQAETLAEVTPVSLPGFKHITTHDFTNSEGELMEDISYQGPADYYLTELDGYNRTLLSLKLKYSAGDSGNRIELAGTGSSSGFMVYPNATGTQLVISLFAWEDNAIVDVDYFPIWIYADKANVDSFLDEFILQLSFEFGDFNEDSVADEMRLGIYINGELYEGNHQVIPGCKFQEFGNCLTVGAYGGTIDVASVVPEQITPKPTQLEGFRNLTTTSFSNSSSGQMGNKRYEASELFNMRDLQGNRGGSFDRTLLSLQLKYELGRNDCRVEMAGKDSTSAFMLHANASGSQLIFTMSNWNNPIADADVYFRIEASKTDVFNFLNEEFIFQLSTEYGNFDDDELEDDMRVGFYINGSLYEDEHYVIPNCKFDTLFGDCLMVYVDAGAITVDAVVPESTDLTPVGWSDYSSAMAGTAKEVTDRLFPISDVPSIFLIEDEELGQMENTAFEAKVTFEQSLYGNEIRFAGKQAEYGLFLLIGNDGNLWLSPSAYSPNFGLEDVLVFDKQIAGVEAFLDKEFTLKITTEFADYDGEGEANDVQLGFYFNGNLYNDQYLYGYNCKEDFGPYFSVYSQSGKIMIRDASDTYEMQIWDLWTDGPYKLESNENQSLLVNGEIPKEDEITMPGDYLVTAGGEETTKKVIIYSERDAHPDDVLDVLDLVATLKGREGVALDTYAGQFGVDEAGADVEDVRERLLQSMGVQKSNAVTFDFIGEDVMPLAGFSGPHRNYDDEYRYNAGRVTENPNFENFLTEEWMQVISEAGINLIAHADPDYGSQIFPGEVEKLLEYGAKYGVGLFVSDNGATKNYAGSSVISLETLRSRVSNYSSYDAFCGLFVVDEPKTDYYPLKTDGTIYDDEDDLKKYISQYGPIARTLQNDLGITCYLNMFPYWENQTYHSKENYEKYVKEFCETLQPKILMWDRYPFDSKDGLANHFYNMDLVRRYANEYQIPFWAAIQAGGQWNDDPEKDITSVQPYYPHEGQFDWNINTCLAFGVQGLDYFPLIQPVHFAYAPDGQYDFKRNGLIGANGYNEDGKLNEWYYYAQDINKHIKAMDHVLMNSVNQGILLNATDAGTRAESPNTILNTKTYSVTNLLADFSNIEQSYILNQGVDRQWSVKNNYISVSESFVEEQQTPTWREVVDVDGNAMIGCFNYNGKTALYVVNYEKDDEQATQNITITLDVAHHVRKIQEAETTYEITQNIELPNMKAGEGVLLVIE